MIKRVGKKVIQFQFLAIMAVLFLLSSCGAGGGEDDGFDDGGSDTGGFCNQETRDTFQSGRLFSADNMAAITISGANQPIQVSIIVRCSTNPPEGQIGNRYDIELSQSGTEVELAISYDEINLGDILEEEILIGSYDGGSQDWLPSGFPQVDPENNIVFSEAPTSGGHALYYDPVDSTGGNLNPPVEVLAEPGLFNRCEVKVSWSEPIGTQTSYNVFRDSTVTANFISPTGCAGADGRCSIIDDSLEPNVNASYTVTARDDLGNSSEPTTPVTAKLSINCSS